MLSLRFQVLNDRDWPVVRVLADGIDPFAAAASDWRGFDPARMLGPQCPLRPLDLGRRVAVYRCSCGFAECGVIAPVVVPSPDGRRVSWVDFRDYVGVFSGPVEESVDRHEGSPWALPDLHFDREQYLAEVERASQDGSWETPRRRTARLLYDRLEPAGLVLPPDLYLASVSPAGNQDCLILMFQCLRRVPSVEFRQQSLRLASAHDNPEHAAEDMTGQLLSTPPDEWTRRFGRHPA